MLLEALQGLAHPSKADLNLPVSRCAARFHWQVGLILKNILTVMAQKA